MIIITVKVSLAPLEYYVQHCTLEKVLRKRIIRILALLLYKGRQNRIGLMIFRERSLSGIVLVVSNQTLWHGERQNEHLLVIIMKKCGGTQ